MICDALGSSSPEVLVAHVAVLAQFARFAPDAFEHKSDVLTVFLLKELLMVPTHPLDVGRLFTLLAPLIFSRWTLGCNGHRGGVGGRE